jgi:hypothetical protein
MWLPLCETVFVVSLRFPKADGLSLEASKPGFAFERWFLLDPETTSETSATKERPATLRCQG